MQRRKTESIGLGGARKGVLAFAVSAGLGLALWSCATPPAQLARPLALENLQAACQADALQAVAGGLSNGVTVAHIVNGQGAPSGAQYVAATASMPAYCRVTGSFVTNPATHKTANYLAVFPANWNGKYLQIGCSGTCGAIIVNDPTVSYSTISLQGLPGDVIRRGYAAFATDQGHADMSGVGWTGTQDGVDDFFYRADQVLAHVGKDFTRAFYGAASRTRPSISRSYFVGCSEGGRDALVAASYFPEEFDGIVAGSPANNFMMLSLQTAGMAIAGARSPDANVSPALLQRMSGIVMAQCDAVDGVADGLIQNPAACNFRPERDLPRCANNAPGADCFTQAQIETISTAITAVTDEHGAVLYGAYTVSELQAGASMALPPGMRADPAGPFAGAFIRNIVHAGDPNFQLSSVVTLRNGGPGEITDYRTVTPRAEYDRAMQVGRMGIGNIPENADRLLRANRKLLIWENLSDEKLAPFATLNYYNQLAARNGGFANLQRNARLFSIPGSTHCSITATGANSFDALGAMESWVEHGQAPNALTARLYPTRPGPMATQMPSYYYDQAPVRSMPLCMYPQMARYSGSGDVKDGANWSCPANDTRMLTLGESGKRAGAFVYDGR